jgi:hypothetical protein
LTIARRAWCGPACNVIWLHTELFVVLPLSEIPSIHLKHFVSKDRALQKVSDVMVQLSQPYNRMDIMCSSIFVGKLISLLLQILVNFAMADVVTTDIVLISVVE